MAAVPLGSDADRLNAAARGDVDAVDWLLDEVAPVAYGFIYARVGGDDGAAEDLLQETLVEVVSSADGFRGDAAVTTWVCAIARRRLARHYERERQAEVTRSRLQLVVSEQATADDTFERRDEVTRALGRLPVLHRQVLVMKYLDDLTVEQIGQQLGKPAVQVQSLLQRARAGLRRELEGAS